MILFLAFSGIGLVIGLLGVPLWKRKVPPNHLYGLRVPATMHSPSVWYEVNAKSGVFFMVTGAAIAAVALIVMLLDISESRGVWVNTGFLLVATVTLCLKSTRLASSLAKVEGGRGG